LSECEGSQRERGPGTTGERERAPRLATVTPLAAGDPRRVGRYVLLGRLGEGGMGAVYLGRLAGRDGSAAPLAAVKVVHRELAEDAEFRARFADEVAAARRVAPFCTAGVLDADPTASPPYLATEYIDGVPLGRAVTDGGPLDESALHGVALGVAAALAAIHSAGVVHRDLKPGNVLLSLSGPRVIDFGIARALDAAAGHTMAGTILGTPGWMAPEQFRCGRVGPAADVFSWGSLVGYAATGRNPWGEEGPPAALAYRIIHQQPDLAGLAGPLRALVEAALRKDPVRRPSARELVLALLGAGRVAGSGTDRTVADPTVADPTVLATHLLQRTWTAPPTLVASPTLVGSPAAGTPAVPVPPAAPPASSAPSAPARPASCAQSAPSARSASSAQSAPSARSASSAQSAPPAPRAPAAGGQPWPTAAGPHLAGAPPAAAPYPARSAHPGGPPRTAVSPPRTALLPRRTAVLPPGTAVLPHRPPPPPPDQPAGPPGRSTTPPHRPGGPYRRPRRRWYRKRRYLVPLGLLVLLTVGSSGWRRQNGEATTLPRGSAPAPGRPADARPQIGVPVRDGQLEFVLEKWRCGVPEIGHGIWVRRASGQYCLADLRVRNIGTDSRTLFEPLVKLYDADGKRHNAQPGARFYLGDQTLWSAVDPGETVSGTAAFDIPESSRGDRLELHDGLLSGGTHLLV